MKNQIYVLMFCLTAMFLTIIPCNAKGGIKLSEWIPEDSSGKVEITKKKGVMDIVSPDGLTLWYNKKLTGNYEITYQIKVVMDNGKYDRLSDMNCFWGAKDPKNPNDIHARATWRNGIFKNYNTMSLFYVGQGGNDNGTTRFREYHGEFYGIDDAKIKPILGEYKDAEHLLKANHWYEIKIRANEGMTSYTCDGIEFFKTSATQAQTDGYFAIRLWINHVQVKNFKVKSI